MDGEWPTPEVHLVYPWLTSLAILQHEPHRRRVLWPTRPAQVAQKRTIRWP